MLLKSRLAGSAGLRGLSTKRCVHVRVNAMTAGPGVVYARHRVCDTTSSKVFDLGGLRMSTTAGDVGSGKRETHHVPDTRAEIVETVVHDDGEFGSSDIDVGKHSKMNGPGTSSPGGSHLHVCPLPDGCPVIKVNKPASEDPKPNRPIEVETAEEEPICLSESNPIVDLGPILKLKELIAAGKLTKSIARQHLQDFRDDLRSLPDDEAQRRIKAAEAGKTVLLWLWDQYPNMTNDDGDLICLTTLFCVYEGRERLVWNWIKINEPSKHDTKLFVHRSERYRWRTLAATGLAMAKAQDMEGSLDAAIKVMWRILDHGKSGTFIPWLGVETFLTRQLTRPMPMDKVVVFKEVKWRREMPLRSRYPKTSDFQWYRFSNFIRTTQGENGRWRLVMMRVNHPRQPDPYPALHLLQEAIGDEDHDLHKINNVSAKRLWSNAYKRCAILLKKQGQVKLAEMVLETSSRFFDGQRIEGRTYRKCYSGKFIW